MLPGTVKFTYSDGGPRFYVISVSYAEGGVKRPWAVWDAAYCMIVGLYKSEADAERRRDRANGGDLTNDFTRRGLDFIAEHGRLPLASELGDTRNCVGPWPEYQKHLLGLVDDDTREVCERRLAEDRSARARKSRVNALRNKAYREALIAGEVA